MNSIEIFPWNKNFNTGLPAIDEQHKNLVRLLNQLASHGAFNSEIPALNVIFDELANYAVYHFQTEEAIWHEYLPEDPMEAMHKEVHDKFISTVLRLKNEEPTKSVDSKIEEILAFLTRWLVSHILEDDMYLAKVVLAMQSGISLKLAKKNAREQMRGLTSALMDIILTICKSLSINSLQLIRELAELKKAEQQLRIAAAAFESQEGMFITDANNVILRVNHAFTNITGYSAEEAIGQTPRLLHSGRHHKAFYSAMWESINNTGVWEGEIWNRRKSGEVYPEYLAITTVKGEDNTFTHYVGTLIDITLRRQTEDALRISEERLQLSQRAAGLGIFDRDLTSGALYLDERARALWGLEPEADLTYEKFLARIHPEDRAATRAAVDRACDPTGNGDYHQDFRIIRPIDGIERWLSASGRVFFEAGHAVRHVGTLQDITESKQAKETLRKSRDQLKTFIQQAPLSIAMFDRDMNYLANSSRWLVQHGRGYADLIGRNHYEVHPDLPAEWKVIHQQVLAGATLENNEDRWIQNDGSTHWLRWTALPWIDENAKIGGIIITAEDITAQKMMEMEVIERRNDLENLQKLQIAAHTASAIAHELNQPLAAISAYSEVALHALGSKTAGSETALNRALKGCVEQAQRAGQSLHELLDFLQKSEVALQPLDLNDIVREALSMTQNDGFGGFRQVLELEHDLPPVLGNRIQVQKVLVNLIHNGVEAMREAGTPTFAITVKVQTTTGRNMARVTVQDSGPGLDFNTAKRIFEPFFTTKLGGIGLGLAISRSLIEAMRGQLWLDPDAGPGATFHFTLPFAP